MSNLRDIDPPKRHKYIVTLTSDTRVERLDKLLARAVHRDFAEFTIFREEATEIIGVEYDPLWSG